jgi:hypothetical protein
MRFSISMGRRAVSTGLAFAAFAMFALSTSATAAPDSVVLPAMDAATPQGTLSVDRATVKQPSAVSASAAALLVKQQANGTVAMPDDREFPFPRGWMLALLAVLAIVVIDRVRTSVKLAKLNQDAVRASGLSAPFARN